MEIVKDALLSECRKYRYTLTRTWDPGHFRALFLMVNPSMADHKNDDPTVKRCMSFAQSWGAGSLVIANWFAFRSSEPEDLLQQVDPVGPRNRRILKDLLFDAKIVVCAWGSHGNKVNALIAEEIPYMQWSLNSRELWCLGTTQDGSPRHPLFLPRSAELEPFAL